MSEQDRALEQIERAAAELVPQLSERLARHGLGEIEVRRGDLRVRVVASAAAPGAVAATSPAAAASHPARVVPAAVSAPKPDESHAVASPAVGYFLFADGLGPGLAIEKGDALGYVDVLGVRHEVRAPRSGTVRNLVAESGEAVEYGQVVIEIEPAGATP
ncbi:MAG: biotin/lipoyl-containing protein [Chloroflexota bacterium]